MMTISVRSMGEHQVYALHNLIGFCASLGGWDVGCCAPNGTEEMSVLSYSLHPPLIPSAPKDNYN